MYSSWTRPGPPGKKKKSANLSFFSPLGCSSFKTPSKSFYFLFIAFHLFATQTTLHGRIALLIHVISIFFSSSPTLTPVVPLSSPIRMIFLKQMMNSLSLKSIWKSSPNSLFSNFAEVPLCFSLWLAEIFYLFPIQVSANSYNLGAVASSMLLELQLKLYPNWQSLSNVRERETIVEIPTETPDLCEIDFGNSNECKAPFSLNSSSSRMPSHLSGWCKWNL